MKVKVLPVAVLLFTALTFATGTGSIYIESPILAYVLGTSTNGPHSIHLNNGAIVYSNSTIPRSDPYANKAFLPLAPIVLVDTGVNYNPENFLCQMTGYAPAALINYLKNEGLCVSTGTITLEQLSAALGGPVNLIDTSIRTQYTIPNSPETYEYCITTSEKLVKAGFDIHNTTVDTIIILQPLDWKSDLVGHGTAVASLLCGKATTSATDTANSNTLYTTLYMGAAIGANVYVVNAATYAIILEGYTPQLTSSIIPQVLIEGAKQQGKTIALDYDFSYLGNKLAALDVIYSIQDAASAGLASALSSSVYKPILLDEIISPSLGETDMQTYCSDFQNALTQANIHVAVAPLPNQDVDVGVQLNNNGLYVFPAQCSQFISSSDYMLADPQVIAVSGFEPVLSSPATGQIEVSATDSNGNVHYYGAFDPANTIWLRGPAQANISATTATSISQKVASTNIGGTSYGISLEFGTDVPAIINGGSILDTSGASYESLLIPVEVTYNSTGTEFDISVTGGIKGTSAAAAYEAAVLSLMVFDNSKIGASGNAGADVASILDASGYINGNYDFNMANVWPIVVYYGAYPSSTWPYTLPSNNNPAYLVGALPSSGSSGGYPSMSSTMPSQSSSTSSASTSTAKPEIAQVNFPGVALLAPLFSKLFARRRSKKSSKEEKQ